MSEQYVDSLKTLIVQLEQLSLVERDRLELAIDLRWIAVNLSHSVTTWLRWFSDPELVTQFSQTELAEMLTDLRDASLALFRADLKWTKIYESKPLELREDDRRGVA